jgi:hypothetical protein
MDDSGVCDPNVDPFCFENDGGTEAAPPCTGLQCQIVNCGSANGTSLSGKVYDPAGRNPLYNVFVYVPNKPLDPIPDNGPACTACQAPASGQPIASAVTDAKGEFLIKNVPVGTNIPLVMQIGKWRRQVVIPQVKQCVDNPLTDKNLTRLPRKFKEGSQYDHIPKIAFTSGCDWAECFLNRIGIDVTEFGAPGSAARVHVYRGDDEDQAFPTSTGDAYALWGNLNELKKYDIVFNSCECYVPDRNRQGPAYANMKAYLDGGGRFFGTHYHYNWFAPPTGPADFQSQAPWLQSTGYNSPPFDIDTSFPRGKAFADWLAALNNPAVSPSYGKIAVTDTRNDVPGFQTSQYKNTTRWITSNNQTLYLSFNTPTNQPPMNQCGRAVFSDVHLSGDDFLTSAQFPNRCAGITGYDGNEIGLEYLFFDLSSCVQDDSQPPVIPPPN